MISSLIELKFNDGQPSFIKSKEIDVSIIGIIYRRKFMTKTFKMCLTRKSLYPRGPSDEESGGLAAKPLAPFNHDESNFVNEILGIIE